MDFDVAVCSLLPRVFYEFRPGFAKHLGRAAERPGFRGLLPGAKATVLPACRTTFWRRCRATHSSGLNHGRSAATLPAKADRQRLRCQERLYPEVSLRSEPEIDVVPENRGIPADLGGGARNDLAMRVPLDDFESRMKGRVVQRVRKLAQSTTDIGNDAAFPEFAPLDITFMPAGPADLRPEAECAARGNFNSV